MKTTQKSTCYTRIFISTCLYNVHSKCMYCTSLFSLIFSHFCPFSLIHFLFSRFSLLSSFFSSLHPLTFALFPLLSTVVCVSCFYSLVFSLLQLRRRLEGWPNTAARLAGWRRVTQQGVILYVMDGPTCLPRRATPIARVWG
jgi:hypothetical protein